MSVILLAYLSLFLQHLEHVVKWTSSFGIVLAFLEMIMILSMYPRLGGQISIMFYNITTHLLKNMPTPVLLVLGFANAFFILHYRTDSQSFSVRQKQ